MDMAADAFPGIGCVDVILAVPGNLLACFLILHGLLQNCNEILLLTVEIVNTTGHFQTPDTYGGRDHRNASRQKFQCF